jgi:small subunit ribosomal protein S6
MQYELTILFSGSKTEEENNEYAKQVDELLKSANAEVKHTHSIGRKKLAYTIGGQTHGEYRVWLFQAESEHITELNEKLRLSQFVMRHLTAKLENVSIDVRAQSLDDVKTGKSAAHFEEAEEKEAQQAQEEQKPSVVEPIKTEKPVEKSVEPEKDEKKVSLEDLDEKLDEILESDKL